MKKRFTSLLAVAVAGLALMTTATTASADSQTLLSQYASDGTREHSIVLAADGTLTESSCSLSAAGTQMVRECASRTTKLKKAHLAEKLAELKTSYAAMENRSPGYAKTVRQGAPQPSAAANPLTLPSKERSSISKVTYDFSMSKIPY